MGRSKQRAPGRWQLALALAWGLLGCPGSGSVDFDGDGVADLDDCAETDPSVYPGASDPFGDGIDQDCDGFDGIDRDGDGAPAVTDDPAVADCNDNAPLTHPGAEDAGLDGTDQNCDGVDGVDADGDGQASLGTGGRDCDDTDAAIGPFAEELCGDGVDQDCSGQADDLDADGDGALSAACGGVDCDAEDPAVSPFVAELCGDSTDEDCSGSADDRDLDGDGHLDLLCGGDDCDDERSTTNPNAVELCDGLDNDCSGAVDDRDADGDGAIAEACGGDDCDDLDPTSLPGGLEVADGADNDCDGTTDEDTVLADDDGDGLAESEGDCDDGDAAVAPNLAELCGDGVDNDCSFVADDLDADVDGYVALACGGGDCDDGDPAVNPGAVEVCGGSVDEDCSGAADDRDADSDGARDEDCGGPDCDDDNASINPFAAELCGGSVDEDCSGAVDDRDLDLDGHIDGACGGDDCDDLSSSTFPGGIESCDGVDNDCSGVVDDRDADGDGAIAEACGGDDCDDLNAVSYPGAPEYPDSTDNDCDGVVDEDTVVFDDDGDGWCESASCIDGSLPGDCDDNSSLRSPSLVELCNGFDDDCNPVTDENVDLDGDGATLCDGDCQPVESTARPGGFEVAGDGLDNDCDGVIDPAGSPTCTRTVPVTHATISAGLAGLGAGELVCVEPGFYDETITITGVGRGLVGLAGPAATVIRPLGGSPVAVVTIEGDTDRSTLLQGFTIDGAGGASTGIHAEGGGPTLRDLVVENIESDSGTTPGWAGGIELIETAALLEDTTVQNCSSTLGWEWFTGAFGAVGAGGVVVVDGSPEFRRVLLADNWSGTSNSNLACQGGAMTVWGATITAVDLRVVRNTAWGYGGGLVLASGTGTFDGLEVLDNRAGSPTIPAGKGGGIYVMGGEWTIARARVMGNSASAAGGIGAEIDNGMGFYGNPASLHLLASWFEDNAAYVEGATSNSIDYFGRGGALNGGSGVTIDNGVFVGNSGRLAGAIDSISGVVVRNSVFHSNFAGDESLTVPAAQTLWGSGLATDCAFTDNDAVFDPAVGGTSVGPDFTYEHCAFDGNSYPAVFDATFPDPDTPAGTDGNIDQPPGYLDLSLDDFRLAPGSALIDAGSTTRLDPDGSPADIGAFGGPHADRWDLDLDGYPRPWAPGGQILPNGHWSLVASDEPAGPTFNWTDLLPSGTPVALDDEDHVLVPLGFGFPVAGSTYDEVAISSNGGLVLGDAPLDAANGSLPATVAAPFIAAYWDDLDPSSGGQILYQTTGSPGRRVFTVQWREVPHVTASGPAGPIDVQASLHEGTGDIVLRYNAVTFGLPTDAGAGATVGAQASPGAWTEFSSDEPRLADGMTIRLRAWDCDDDDSELAPGRGCP